jgi:hypothetical protein
MIKIELEHNIIEIPNFELVDFDCKCGCGLNNIRTTFLWKVQLTRTEANFPFIVNSGCRCKKHNKDEDGEPTSDHLTGEGVDIKVTGSWQRLVVVSAAIKNGFKRIGIANTFIHLGDNLRQNPAGIWIYK